MNQEKNNDNGASLIRLIGNIVLVGGIILLVKSQLMELTLEPDNIPDFQLIADKTNYTILGGFLIIIGLQLSLVSNKITSEIKDQFKKPI